MPLFPTTTSGIVVLSGSNNFDSLSSDFPVVIGSAIVVPSAFPYIPIHSLFNLDPVELMATMTGITPGVVVASLTEPFSAFAVPTTKGTVLQFDRDIRFRQNTVTTSGVVIIEFSLDILQGYIVPVVINSRLYPVSRLQRMFPTQVRDYPRLPQYSIIIP